jgi:hypothetical protein
MGATLKFTSKNRAEISPKRWNEAQSHNNSLHEYPSRRRPNRPDWPEERSLIRGLLSVLTEAECPSDERANWFGAVFPDSFTPAINVDATAPIPGINTPNLPFAGVIVVPFLIIGLSQY